MSKRKKKHLNPPQTDTEFHWNRGGSLKDTPHLEQLYSEGWINLEDVDFALEVGHVAYRRPRNVPKRRANAKSPFFVD